FAYPFFLSNLIWSFGGKWIANSLDFNKNYDASVFETTIRLVVEGLLSAYDILAHGNPHNPRWTGVDSILADSGTEQLEFIALSQRTGNPKYRQKVENVILFLSRTFPADGLLPIYVNPQKGTTSYSTITSGAMGDRYNLFNMFTFLSSTCFVIIS
ncbi:unnamed protein product, partial [Coffea canephora]